MSKVKKVKNWQEMIELARKAYAETAKNEVEAVDWDTVKLNTALNLSDFVEGRILGLDEEKRRIEHEIREMSFRLPHIADQARKNASEAVLQKYSECYLRVMDLDFQQKIFEKARSLLRDGTCVMNQEQRAELENKADENRQNYQREMEKLPVYQGFMASFFRDNAVRPPAQDAAAETERQVLQEISAALPQGQQYDPYRTRAGYENQTAAAMNPRSATLIMNPNIIAGVTVDNYAASIHGKNPSRTSIEWGASTFDSMMEGLYTPEQWEMMKRDEVDILGTVYLNGKPATDIFPKKDELERYSEYQKRVRSEIVAFALEGKGSIQVSPFIKENGKYTFRDPVPVRTKVNLEEKVSAWTRFLRFLNIKVETKKEKAERVSLEALNQREHLDEARRNVDRLVRRENVRQMVKDKIEQNVENVHQGERDFFGFLVPGDRDEVTEEKITNAVVERVHVAFSEKMAEKLGLKHGEFDMLGTMHRFATRTQMVRLFAMTRGMSLKEVVSPDPALRERKEAIGREFMELISLKSEEEFMKEAGPTGDYQAYFNEKTQKVYDMLKEQHRVLGDIPFDFFKGTEPADLMERYDEWSFISTVSQDIFQCCPREVKARNFDELDAMERKARSLGELRMIEQYYEDYLATELFAQVDLGNSKTQGEVASAVVNQEHTRRLIEDTKNITRVGDLDTVLTRDWSFKSLSLRSQLASRLNPEDVKEMHDFLENGGKPVFYYDEKTQDYVTGKAADIEKAMQAQQREADRSREAADWKNFEEIAREEAKRPVERQAKEAPEKAAQKAPKQKAAR